MTTERHTTIIEADVSQYLAADAKLRAADEARTAAAKKLAAVLEEGERERIASMRASHDAATRQAAMRRMDARDARTEMAAARADATAARQDIAARSAEERKAAAESKRAAAEREGAYRRIAAQDQRIADQREAAYRREAQMIDRVAAARDAAYSRLEAGANRATAAFNRQNAAEGRLGGRGGAGVMGGLATGAAVGGAAGAAVVGGVAAVSAGIGLTNDLVNESYTAQAVSRNLQISIAPARAELKGMVSDLDLAAAANKAFAMDVADTGDEFAHFAGMVGEQATKLGVDQGQLIMDLTEGVGKQESEMMDNAGITMRITDAYALYAEQLDKSVSSLTKAERAEAFKKATIIALEQATGRATVGVEGFAASWKKAGVEYENFRGRFMKFDDMTGRANEAMRELSDEQLDRLRFAEALNDEDAKRADAMGKTAREMQGHVEQWGLSIMDLKKHAEQNGQTYLEMLDAAKAAHAAQFETDKDNMLAAAQQESLDIMNAEADTLEHTGELLKIYGATEREVLEMDLSILEARQMAAITQAKITKDVKDEAAAKKIANDIELTTAKIEMLGKKKGGKGADPNAALDRETDATLRLLDARSKVYAAELDGERDLESVAATRSFLLSLEREALDVREEAANSRKVRGPEETAKLEAERLEILTERRLLDVDATKLAAEEGRRQGDERLAAMDREIEMYEAQGVAVGLLQRRRDDAHLALVAQYGSDAELAGVEHERKLAEFESDRELATTLAQRKADAFTMETETATARGQQIYDIKSRQLELESQIAGAEGDHDRKRQLLHQREVARIEERRAKMQRATANANSIVAQGAAVFEMINGRSVKNEEKRAKAALRARGVESIARGALETVESVAAFASLNVPLGILHAVAAGIAFTTGFPMIAGKEPGGGSAAAAVPAGGGADHQTVLGPAAEERASGTGSGRDLPATPPSAEALMRMRNGTGSMAFGQTEAKGGTVINISNSTVVSGDAGSLLADLGTQDARKWGSP
jgi:KaiC/GvpD/RAD55 family RecA-like ATPase